MELEKAQTLKVTNKNAAIDILYNIVKRNVDTNSENDIKTKEQAILDLGELLAATGQAEGNWRTG
uniref:26S proteasome non-ATPase regulatory subunit 11 n=1 Tax=Magallana gigas TaxID=29159 RepID=K1PZD9_MAGGI